MMVRDLAWLVQLGELGHVTETAAALGTSQPTLSRALARLEDELGVRVFERTPTGVEPTPDGRLVLDAARDLVARHDQPTDAELQTLGETDRSSAEMQLRE